MSIRYTAAYLQGAGGPQSLVVTPSGGFSLGGSAAVVRTRLIVAVGGLLLAGHASSFYGRVQAGAGGFVVSGTAAVSFGTGTSFKCTILTSDGVIRMILDSEVGTGKKPLVLDGDRWRQRQVAEGTAIIDVNGRYRLLHPGETLIV